MLFRSFFSLRETAIYAIGLISKTLEGRCILKKYNWVSYCKLGGIICYPKDISRIIKIPLEEYKGDYTKNKDIWNDFEENLAKYNCSEKSKKLIMLISKLSNRATQKTSFPNIKKFVQMNPEILMDPKIFHCISMIFENYTFKLQVRRYIFQLFEKLITSANFLSDYDSAINCINDK